jgi:hypothetical protein
VLFSYIYLLDFLDDDGLTDDEDVPHATFNNANVINTTNPIMYASSPAILFSYLFFYLIVKSQSILF